MILIYAFCSSYIKSNADSMHYSNKETLVTDGPFTYHISFVTLFGRFPNSTNECGRAEVSQTLH